MKTGYFLPVSLNHQLVLLWGIIILSFERTLFYEFNKEGNWFLTILAIVSYIIFITLIWPHRFFIADDELHFTTFPRVRMKTIELKYITAVKTTKFGFGFSYAGKRYQFFTFGKSKEALATLHDTIEHSDKVSDLKA
ncbi:hypothetical protein Llc71_08380 [Lactococcus cremoris]|uniref:EbsA family protein n=1 Tax=Lactococcus lactis subsp. cremoris TaxID=1359 RepID=UPI0020BF633C|nr:EbsA family protein [Lactococcus cremoris]BDE09143.1 hypothetical protein Llc71_08380 [Lactococcus cremoris]